MAKSKRDAELSRLIPKSMTIKTDSGTIVVAGNSEENKILNYLIVGQIRDLVQSTLKKWKDSEQVPSPKDLKDIAAAGRDLCEFSDAVYKGADELQKPDEKQAEPVNDDDFSALAKEVDIGK